MKPPRIKIVPRDENGVQFFYLDHSYFLPDVPGAPADGPYESVDEAQAAAGLLRDAWLATGDLAERSLADPAKRIRPTKSAGEV